MVKTENNREKHTAVTLALALCLSTPRQINGLVQYRVSMWHTCMFFTSCSDSFEIRQHVPDTAVCMEDKINCAEGVRIGST